MNFLTVSKILKLGLLLTAGLGSLIVTVKFITKKAKVIGNQLKMSFLKDPELQSAENLLKSYGKFLRGYKESLRKKLLPGATADGVESQRNICVDFGGDTENVSIFELLDSENKILNKILIVFFHLGGEAKRLNNGSKEIIKRLIIIEDEIKSSDNNELTPEEATNNVIVKFSYALEDLLNMKFLIQNSIFLSVNVIHQFSALFAMEKYFCITPSSCFPSNLDDVGMLLKNLMVLDEIFTTAEYQVYLSLYGEFISAQEGQMDENILRNLQNTLHELQLLLDGNIFQIAIDNLVALKTKIKPKALIKLESFILVYIKNLVNAINMYDSNISELTEVDEVIKLNIFMVVYQSLFDNCDPKTLRLVTEMNNRHCTIIIHNILWNGNEFLRKNIPALFKFNLDVAKMQQSYMSQRVQSLGKDSTLMYASQVRSLESQS